MTEPKTDRQALSEAVGKVVDRFTRKHKDLSVVEVCAALGVVAGTVTAVNVPSGFGEADVLAGNALGLGFGEAVKAARALRAN